jgi:hypothetical protein
LFRYQTDATESPHAKASKLTVRLITIRFIGFDLA